MRIDGKNYKSLNFTVLEAKLRDFSKDQTYRTNFLPKYRLNHIIIISFEKEFLYLARVLMLYPKQVKDLNLEEAKHDGFDSVKAFQQTIFDLNIKAKSPSLRRKKEIDYLEQWGIITRFKHIIRNGTVLDWLNKNEKGLIK